MNTKHMLSQKLSLIHRMKIVMIEKVKKSLDIRKSEVFYFHSVPVDELLWSPSSANDFDNGNIDEYLKRVHTECKSLFLISFMFISCLLFCKDPPSDDEISLQTLLKCQFNIELALTKFRQLPTKTICKSIFKSFDIFNKNCIVDSYPAWSLTEIVKFEEGLIEHGKNFFKIAHYKVSLVILDNKFLFLFFSVRIDLFVK